MTFFNSFGLLFMFLMMIPNIIYAIKCPQNKNDDFSVMSKIKFTKVLEIFEQIGRYGCFACMIFNIPGTCFGFSSELSFSIYLIINFVLIFTYCIIWIFCFKENNLFKILSLSILPSIVFLFSGIISRSVLLIAAAIIFAPCHVIISVRNYK